MWTVFQSWALVLTLFALYIISWCVILVHWDVIHVYALCAQILHMYTHTHTHSTYCQCQEVSYGLSYIETEQHTLEVGVHYLEYKHIGPFSVSNNLSWI